MHWSNSLPNRIGWNCDYPQPEFSEDVYEVKDTGQDKSSHHLLI